MYTILKLLQSGSKDQILIETSSSTSTKLIAAHRAKHQSFNDTDNDTLCMFYEHFKPSDCKSFQDAFPSSCHKLHRANVRGEVFISFCFRLPSVDQTIIALEFLSLFFV